MAKSPFVRAADSKRYNIGAIKRPKNYDPLKDKGDYMNPKMLSYFWQQLQNKYNGLGHDIAQLRDNNLSAERSSETMDTTQAHVDNEENILRIEKYTQQRRRIKMVIDEIEVKGSDSDYGYCVDTDDEIGVQRLMSRPEARTCVTAQENRERAAGQHARHLRADIVG